MYFSFHLFHLFLRWQAGEATSYLIHVARKGSDLGCNDLSKVNYIWFILFPPVPFVPQVADRWSGWIFTLVGGKRIDMWWLYVRENKVYLFTYLFTCHWPLGYQKGEATLSFYVSFFAFVSCVSQVTEKRRKVTLFTFRFTCVIGFSGVRKVRRHFPLSCGGQWSLWSYRWKLILFAFRQSPPPFDVGVTCRENSEALFAVLIPCSVSCGI